MYQINFFGTPQPQGTCVPFGGLVLYQNIGQDSRSYIESLQLETSAQNSSKTMSSPRSDMSLQENNAQ